MKCLTFDEVVILALNCIPLIARCMALASKNVLCKYDKSLCKDGQFTYLNTVTAMLEGLAVLIS